jgi:hypothetical protein
VTSGSVEDVRTSLTALSGGYLRNMVIDDTTCNMCFTPFSAGPLCWRCQQDSRLSGFPTFRGFLAYASHDEPINQSGRLMRHYKGALSSPDMTIAVSLIAALGLRAHTACVSTLSGMPVTSWATVPSLPRNLNEHALHGIVLSLARPGSNEIVLEAAEYSASPRAVNPQHFKIIHGSPRGAHVLLIDDTWTSGGHMLSAALALRTAGATKVSTLALARWLTVGWEETTSKWMRAHLTRPDFDAARCPWTQGACPS